MNKDYELKIINRDGVNLVEFTNNTQKFIEVVLAVDGIDLKTGEKFSHGMRGYCYPPGYSREIKRPAVNVTSKSVIKAYIYPGTGKYKIGDYTVPTFLRYKLYDKGYSTRNITSLIQRKLNRKAIFTRFSPEPAKVLCLSS